MKMKVVLFCLLISVITYGQDIKKVTVKAKNGDTETYYVLKSDRTIRHGGYQSSDGNRILLTGSYKNGKEDSIWTKYNWSGKVIWQGNYKAGVKTGVWLYNDLEGDLEQKYDWDKKEIILDKNTFFTKQKGSYRIISDTVPGDKVTPSIYIGGGSSAVRSVLYTINYPDNARENDISGSVIIEFKLDTAGKTSDHKVSVSIAKDLDMEALRVVRLIPDCWVPAKINGKPSDCILQMPVTFKLAN